MPLANDVEKPDRPAAAVLPTSARRLTVWRVLLATVVVVGPILLIGLWSEHLRAAHLANAIPPALVPIFVAHGCTWRIALLSALTVLACLFPAPGPQYGEKTPPVFSAALLALLILPPEIALAPLAIGGGLTLLLQRDPSRRAALLDRLLLTGASQTVTGIVLSRVYFDGMGSSAAAAAQLAELLRAGAATAALMAALALAGFSLLAVVRDRADAALLAAALRIDPADDASSRGGNESRRGIAWSNEAAVTLLGGACVTLLSIFYARMNPFGSTAIVLGAFAVLIVVARALVDGKLARLQLKALERLTQQAAIGKSPGPEKILSNFLEHCSRLMLYDRASIWLLSAEELVLEKQLEYSGISDAPVSFQPAVRRSGEELVGRVAARPRSILVSDTRRSPSHRDHALNAEAKQALGPASAMLIPLLAAGELIGVVEFERRSLTSYTEADRARIQGLVGLVAISLANIRLHSDVVQQAVTDGLTGLYNKRQILKTLADEASRAKRYTNPLSVMMLDLDGFKKFNDTYGHMQGDVLLQRLAELIKASIRNTDIAGRYGGEEFMVVMPETNREAAWVTAERIRARIEAEEFPVIVNYEAAIGLAEATTDERQPREVIVRKTISIGVATYPADALDDKTLLARADEALYVAKNTGRNKVVLAGRSIESQPKLVVSTDAAEAA